MYIIPSFDLLCRDPRVKMDQWDLKAHLVMKGRRDLLVKLDLMGLTDTRDPQDPQDPLGLLETRTRDPFSTEAGMTLSIWRRYRG